MTQWGIEIACVCYLQKATAVVYAVGVSFSVCYSADTRYGPFKPAPDTNTNILRHRHSTVNVKNQAVLAKHCHIAAELLGNKQSSAALSCCYCRSQMFDSSTCLRSADPCIESQQAYMQEASLIQPATVKSLYRKS
eukprot:GHUV01028616.1.p1 GENE.GHUV01028616.1~~GHUV01028616.1.p1  ORF type:complete len:136 (-),score=13.70 GHUV01028616.1:236-643(-)